MSPSLLQGSPCLQASLTPTAMPVTKIVRNELSYDFLHGDSRQSLSRLVVLQTYVDSKQQLFDLARVHSEERSVSGVCLHVSREYLTSGSSKEDQSKTINAKTTKRESPPNPGHNAGPRKESYTTGSQFGLHASRFHHPFTRCSVRAARFSSHMFYLRVHFVLFAAFPFCLVPLRIGRIHNSHRRLHCQTLLLSY